MWRTVLALMVVASAVRGQVQETSRRPVIDPEADTVLRRLGERNKQLKSAVFRVTDTIDEVQDDGQKIQFSHVRELTVVPPNKLRVVTTGDVTSRTFWKDGKTLTVLDRDKNVYAQLPDPGTIDQAIDMLQAKYNLSMPAADLLSDDIYQTMTAGCDAIRYVGVGLVGDEKCHHLAATRKDIDWQLWVTMGDQPAMRKLVITYKRLPGAPQYTLQLLAAGDASQITDAVFACEIPKGAERIELRQASRAAGLPTGEAKQAPGQRKENTR